MPGNCPYGDYVGGRKPLEEVGGVGVLWAGTEPSALFRSEDGGRTWQERVGLQALPSKPSWSFPPRPWTHHATHPAEPGVFYAATRRDLYRSVDAGESWQKLPIPWPAQAGFNTVNAIVVTETV